MTTRKILKRNVAKLQYEVRILDTKIQNLSYQISSLLKQHDDRYKELKEACDVLGKEWSGHCPAFRTIDTEVECVIEGWRRHDSTFCINCPVTHDEALVRGMMCKLRSDPKKKDVF